MITGVVEDTTFTLKPPPGVETARRGLYRII